MTSALQCMHSTEAEHCIHMSHLTEFLASYPGNSGGKKWQHARPSWKTSNVNAKIKAPFDIVQMKPCDVFLYMMPMKKLTCSKRNVTEHNSATERNAMTTASQRFVLNRGKNTKAKNKQCARWPCRAFQKQLQEAVSVNWNKAASPHLLQKNPMYASFREGQTPN